MSRLARCFAEALADTPLDADRAPASARFAELRGNDAAAQRLSPDALRGLARVVASQPDLASFLSHRPAWLERVAELGPDTLAQRGAELAHANTALAELDLEGALDALRLRRREEMALAACAHLGEVVPFEAASEYLSLVAEATTEVRLPD